MKEELIKFLQEKQIPGDWLHIANTFQVLGTNKRKSDIVRKLWNKYHPKTSEVPDTEWEVYPTESVNFVQAGYDISTPSYITTTTSSNTSKKKSSKKGIHLVIGCMHIPFHNKILLKKLVEFIEDSQDIIKGFHLIGDTLDLKSLSAHDEKTIDLSGLTLGKEYAEANKVFDILDSVLPEGIKKTFLYGNHEDRYLRHISNIKNYKTADAIQSPEQALDLERRGYIIKNNWKEDFIQVGKYQLLHGISLSVNPSKTHVEKLRSSCIFAHTHRINQYYEGWLHGLNIGMMGDMDSKGFSYCSRVERAFWKNGFGIINVSGKHSQAEVVVCENDGFFYNGKRY